MHVFEQRNSIFSTLWTIIDISGISEKAGAEEICWPEIHSGVTLPQRNCEVEILEH